jgi:hypothetical protein
MSAAMKELPEDQRPTLDIFDEHYHAAIVRAWVRNTLLAYKHEKKVGTTPSKTPWILPTSGPISDEDITRASKAFNDLVDNTVTDTKMLSNAYDDVHKMDVRGASLRLTLRTYAKLIKMFSTMPSTRLKAHDVYRRAEECAATDGTVGSEQWGEVWQEYMTALACSGENADAAVKLLAQLDEQAHLWFNVNGPILATALYAVSRAVVQPPQRSRPADLAHHIESAMRLYARMRAAGYAGTHVAYTFYMRALTVTARPAKAVEALADMLAAGFKPDDSSVTDTLQAACAKPDAPSATAMLRVALELGGAQLLGPAQIAAVFDCAARSGSPALAGEAWGALAPLGIPHTDHMLNCIACSYANCNQDMDALRAVAQIVAVGGVVENKTLGVIARKLCQSPERIDDAYYELAQVRHCCCLLCVAASSTSA